MAIFYEMQAIGTLHHLWCHGWGNGHMHVILICMETTYPNHNTINYA